MNLLPLMSCVLAFQGSNASSVKPILLATNQEPSRADLALLELEPGPYRDQTLKARKFELREFEKFVLITPPDLLKLEATKRHDQMIKEVTQQLSGGASTLEVGKLSSESQAVLREQIRSVALGRREGLADAANLKLNVGATTTFRMKNGKREFDFTTRSLSPGVGKDPSVMDPLPQAQSIPKANLPSSAPSTVKTLKSTRKLEFVLPQGVPGTDGMEWIAEAQARLLKEVQQAKSQWELSRQALLQALKKEIDGRFSHELGDKLPQFSDLKPEYQSTWGQIFSMGQPGLFGSQGPVDFLSNSQTLRISNEPVLELRVAEERHSNYEVIGVTPIPITCPAGS